MPALYPKCPSLLEYLKDRYPEASEEDKYCPSYCHGWDCYRTTGHTGPHICYVTVGRPHFIWTDDESEEDDE